ncbi:hypothetical protein HYALB_00000642 [Hymenoscyphus albidus]|uniref:L-tryptophan decarboxylase PsiD-like domain-containing protein n=1 Tax=Hymenoscyphus albidus TaxID=595503 RepID=A0A9N9Q2J4_9HELO|nr:hypothetical protein HYALB_00000642 [Hymenoscyphus albidus]
MADACESSGKTIPTSGLDPAVQKLKRHIESEPQLLGLFVQAFQEIPDSFQDKPTKDGFPRIRSYHSMIEAIDRAIKAGPSWISSLGSDCVIGCPMNEAMIWLMNTRAGSDIFLREDINLHLSNILGVWAKHLSSAASTSVLNDGENGWLSQNALAEMLQEVNKAFNAPFQASDFEEVFECQPSLPSYGFRSWDEFFTRRFRPNARPIESPTEDNVVVNPCESQPLLITRDAPFQCQFSLKGTSYSFVNMLDNDPYAENFAGGTVYQGWLSIFNYHRWHTPVSGRVARVLQIRGTYFAADPFQGFQEVDQSSGTQSPDRQAPDASQKLLSSIATRTVILIQADNAKIGLVGFVAIGMSEISSCKATVAVGEHLYKGQEMGSFHYGGSSFCLLFGPEATIQFSQVVTDALKQPVEIGSRCIAVNSELARLE